MDKPIEWSIKEIKDLEFTINQGLEVGELMDTTYTVKLEPVLAEEVIQITISFSFMTLEVHEILMRSTVMTVYPVRDLKLYSSKVNGIDNVNLPDPLWYILFSMAFTHTRAVMAIHAAGTKYSHFMMPPINPEAEFKKMFAEQLKLTSG